MFSLRHLRIFLELLIGFLLMVSLSVLLLKVSSLNVICLIVNLVLVICAIFANSWLARRSNISLKEWLKVDLSGTALILVPGGIYAGVFGHFTADPASPLAGAAALITIFLFVFWLMGYFLLAAFAGILVLTGQPASRKPPAKFRRL